MAPPHEWKPTMITNTDNKTSLKQKTHNPKKRTQKLQRWTQRLTLTMAKTSGITTDLNTLQPNNTRYKKGTSFGYKPIRLNSTIILNSGTLTYR